MSKSKVDFEPVIETVKKLIRLDFDFPNTIYEGDKIVIKFPGGSFDEENEDHRDLDFSLTGAGGNPFSPKIVLKVTEDEIDGIPVLVAVKTFALGIYEGKAIKAGASFYKLAEYKIRDIRTYTEDYPLASRLILKVINEDSETPYYRLTVESEFIDSFSADFAELAEAERGFNAEIEKLLYNQ